ncbi:MAG: hypothetical protein ACOC7U_02310 [Spirochaetota bacterium]
MKQYSDPRMHSAEHILNQTMVRMLGCDRCFSSHIEKKKSKCDYHFHRPLTRQEVDEIQARVNQVIQEDLPVAQEFLDKQEACDRYNLQKLPDHVNGKIRIVKIGGYDACPCIGEHVPSTSRIGTFSITTTSYKEGVLRIRYKLD